MELSGCAFGNYHASIPPSTELSNPRRGVGIVLAFRMRKPLRDLIAHNEGPAGRFTLCRHRALDNYRRLIIGSVVLESKIGCVNQSAGTMVFAKRYIPELIVKHKPVTSLADRKMSWPHASTSGPGFPDRINQYLTHLVFPVDFPSLSSRLSSNNHFPFRISNSLIRNQYKTVRSNSRLPR